MRSGGSHALDGKVIRVEWLLVDGRRYVLVANPTALAVTTEMERDIVDVIYALGEHRPEGLGPWSLVFGVKE
jgi:hypothetical protein